MDKFTFDNVSALIFLWLAAPIALGLVVFITYMQALIVWEVGAWLFSALF